MMYLYEDLFISNKEPYLRPFICKGNPYKAKICLVGINPATPLYPNQISLSDYVSILLKYTEFLEYYRTLRVEQGKTQISRTRLGIHNFVNWLETIQDHPIIETDVITYPTANIDGLVNIKHKVLEQSKALFWKVICEFKPRLVIVYGKMAMDTFQEIMITNNSPHKMINRENSPFGEFQLGNEKSYFFGIKHLMYYGYKGNSFRNARYSIENFIERVGL